MVKDKSWMFRDIDKRAYNFPIHTENKTQFQPTQNIGKDDISSPAYCLDSRRHLTVIVTEMAMMVMAAMPAMVCVTDAFMNQWSFA